MIKLLAVLAIFFVPSHGVFANEFLKLKFVDSELRIPASETRHAESGIEPISDLPFFEFFISQTAGTQLTRLSKEAVGNHINVYLCGKIIAERAFVAEPIMVPGMRLTTKTIGEAERYAQIINTGKCT